MFDGDKHHVVSNNPNIPSGDYSLYDMIRILLNVLPSSESCIEQHENYETYSINDQCGKKYLMTHYRNTNLIEVYGLIYENGDKVLFEYNGYEIEAFDMITTTRLEKLENGEVNKFVKCVTRRFKEYTNEYRNHN